MPSLFPNFAEVRALVIGDCMLDRYIQGTAGRISPEAPVPVIAIERRDACLGGAANVAAGLKALGVRTTLVGVLGDDDDGRAIRRLAERQEIVADLLHSSDDLRTICKTRILADRNQQLVRLDEDGNRERRAAVSLMLMPQLLEGLEHYDVVVLCDYEKGTLPPPLIEEAVRRCGRAGIPVVVDPKKQDFSAYRGASIITPNRLELERAADRSLPTLADVENAAQEIRKLFEFQRLLCTCGAEGMVLAEGDRVERFKARTVQVADVAGAGDTVVSIIAAAIGARVSVVGACHWAVLGAAIAVGKPQVHVVDRAALERARLKSSPKVLTCEKLVDALIHLRSNGQRVVFTNGCFDILHAGHLAYMEEAKALGDVLVVGLNTDASVRRLKGDSRPRVHQEHRAVLLAGLACVDFVVLFEDDTPEQLIRELRPDVLTKGGDYDVSQIVGAEFVRSYGGEVVVLGLTAGLSTTSILSAASR